MAASDDSHSSASASSVAVKKEDAVNAVSVKTDIPRKHSVKRSIPKKSDGVKAPSETRKALTDIETPDDTDVLSGRGNFVNYHPGNLLFRELVQKHKLAYVACPKPQKSGYAELIVSDLRQQGARFLTRNEKTKLWHDIGDKKALMKTRQALREGAPDIAEKMGGKSSTTNPLSARNSASIMAALAAKNGSAGTKAEDTLSGKKRKDLQDNDSESDAPKKSKKGARQDTDKEHGNEGKAAAANRAGVLPPSFGAARGAVSDPNSLRILSEAAESVDHASGAPTAVPTAAVSGATNPAALNILGDAAVPQALPPGYAAALYSLQAQQANPAFALANPYAAAAIPGFGMANPFLTNPLAAAAMYPSAVEADPRVMAAQARLAAAEARLAAMAGSDPRLLMAGAAAHPASYMGLLPPLPTAGVPPPAPVSSTAAPGSPSAAESPQVK